MLNLTYNPHKPKKITYPWWEDVTGSAVAIRFFANGDIVNNIPVGENNSGTTKVEARFFSVAGQTDIMLGAGATPSTNPVTLTVFASASDSTIPVGQNNAGKNAVSLTVFGA